ncbi:hypothetical protein [Paenibacillus sp. GP183]|uniref:hypothetical protein n=1 Tax=Paenibacillus sp. GP183 TaxID=1882751 RepID=UPI00089B007A|nr:hypothetical protein [Paenibacillus sp. GP183]SEB68570.1 hypothetical protein SAMN05443246_1564 [Paenibacillus sp. GP183]
MNPVVFCDELPHDSENPAAFFYDTHERLYAPLFNRTVDLDYLYLEDYRDQSYYMELHELQHKLGATDDHIDWISPVGYVKRMGSGYEKLNKDAPWSPLTRYSLYYDARDLYALWKGYRYKVMLEGGQLIER